jgi:hypothetical protein
MNKVWWEVWPDCVHDFTAFEKVQKIAIKVAAIPQELGIDNAEPDDVNELFKSHSQALTNQGLEDLVAQLTQKQQLQEKPILWSIETHDLQEILVGTDRYLKRLGDIDHDCGTELFYQKMTQCSAAVLLPCSAGQEASSKAKNPPFFF